MGHICPVMRLHGCRESVREPQGNEGGTAACTTGADNELRSFGQDNNFILVKYLKLRERLRAYIRKLKREACDHGSPEIRTMSFEFPDDEKCWEVDRQYMFGEKSRCAPVMEPGIQQICVYLPAGRRWSRFVVGDDDDDDEEVGAWKGGQDVVIPTFIDSSTVFVPLEH